jgi:glycosyltransferase involved in cell wall biosynthesis
MKSSSDRFKGFPETELRVAINAQFLPGRGFGGVESVLTGLIHALGELSGAKEEYVIIGPWENPEWLKPYLGPNARIVSGPKPWPSKHRAMERIQRLLQPLKSLARPFFYQLFPQIKPSPWPQVPVSDGFYESLGCNVIHFPYQEFVLCSLPSVFNPHDLQHRHFPQFFTPQLLARRETIYPAACHLAHTTVVGSQWVKGDLLHHYHLAPEKVQIIPWAPPTQVYPVPSGELLESVKVKYSLEHPFAFYPAATWEHKNHLRLLEALAQLRDRQGHMLRLVCTGTKYPPFWPKIEDALCTLNLNGQVRFLGVVPPEDLRAIYRLAQFVFIPTLFEAASGPVFEAWLEGTAVACSTVTSLPEQVADAAFLFDPFSTEAIANAAKKMSTDDQLRASLINRGARRLLDFSWDRTAKAYRAVYRHAAGRQLSEEDHFLLSWDWMRNPNREEERTP